MSRYRIFARDGFRCMYCGRSSYEHGVFLAADHIVPKSRGGQDVASNLVTACSSCNGSKSKNPLVNEEDILQEVARRNQAIGLESQTDIRPSNKAYPRLPAEKVLVEVVKEVLIWPHPKDLLWSVWSLEEAARKLRKKISEVRKMVRDGELLGRRSGRTWLIIDPDWDDR